MTIQWLSSFDKIMESTHGFETEYLRLLYYNFPGYYSDEYHSYEYPRLCTILNGQKQVSYLGCKPFVYDESQFLLLPPCSTVQMNISVPTRALVVEISEHLINDISQKVSNDLQIDPPGVIDGCRFDFSLSPGVWGAYQHILDTCFSKNDDKPFLLDLYAQELAYYLIRAQNTHAILLTQSSDPLLQTIAYISSHLDEKLGLREIASMANLSPNALIMNFKKLTGMTPGEYRKGVKLSRARDLLRTKTVTETAFELGYENVSHFIHLFKIKYGCTPKHFQMRRWTDPGK